ncbi:MAG: hypothetical protein LBL61_05625 [Elusimicrobiota bacterium]|jgi:hypothetical protein|nr:hypothetical protein [Elusimicrobiota bacterium]
MQVLKYGGAVIKNLFLLFLITLSAAACSAVQNIQNAAVNCKYTLAGVEVTDASFSSVNMTVAMAVSNQSKTAPAKMNRFEGKIYINDNAVSDISFGAMEVAPSSTAIAQAKLTLPLTAIGKNIAGLVATNSISLKYKLAGNIYFDTALGQIPLPVIVEPQKKK